MQLISTEKSTSVPIRVPTFTELATFAAGTLYVLGFVITNVFYASYEIVRFEFFRGRYVAAALLFVCAALLPGWIGWQIGAQFRRSEPMSRRERRQTATIQLSLTSIIVAAIICFILVAVGIGTAPVISVLSFALLIESIFATIGSSAVKIGRSSSRVAVRHMSAGRPIIVVLAMLVTAAIFGRWIYPDISPAFGGGAVNIARIEAVPGTLSQQLQVELDRPVVVIDRDDQVVDIVACSDSVAKSVQPISVSSVNVRAIRLGGLVSLAQAKRELCPTIDEGPEIAPPIRKK